MARGRKPFKKPIELYGPGPDGATCRDCENLIEKTMFRKYYKCAEWMQTFSAATDIRLKWPACGKYKARSEIKEG